MKLDVTATVDGDALPADLWTQQASEQVGAFIVATIVARVEAGMGADGQPFKRYSTRRMYVAKGSNTALRLAPKGGVPIKDKSGKVTSVRYDGGYAQYKRESKRGSGDTVDLVQSGQMVIREIRPTVVTESEVIVQHTGGSAVYGPGVDALRPHMGLAESELADLDAEVAGIVEDILKAGARAPTEPIA